MSSVLVTTDLSSPAAQAYPVAVRLAQALRCELHFLHVVHRPVLTPAFADSAEDDRERAQVELSQLVAAQGSGVIARGSVEIAEDVVVAIGAHARRLAARLLVVAGSGKSGWQKLRLGSISQRLLHAAPVPVVLVPKAVAPRSADRTVVLTTDLTTESLRALPVAQELGAALQLPVTLLGAASDHNAAAAQLQVVKRLAAGAAAELRSAVAVDPQGVSAAIATWARVNDAAFVVMAPRARGDLERWLFGSVVDEVVTRLDVPAVVMPPSG